MPLGLRWGWAAVDREQTRTPGTEEGSLLARRPVCLEGEQKGVLLLLLT